MVEEKQLSTGKAAGRKTRRIIFSIFSGLTTLTKP